MPFPGGLANGFRAPANVMEHGFARNKVVGGVASALRFTGRFGRDVASDAVNVPIKVVRGIGSGLKKYDSALDKTLTLGKDGKLHDIKSVAAAAMIGVPVAAGASAVAAAGTPNYKPTMDYGNWANQNAMTGGLDVAEMGSYDVDRALESARRMRLVKQSGWHGGESAWGMDKTASWTQPLFEAGIRGLEHLKTFAKVVKDPTKFGHKPKPFMDMIQSKRVMLGAGAAFGAYGAANEYGAARRVQDQNVNTYLNLPSQVPQL